MKRLLLAALLSMAITTPCYADHALAMSYILADQDLPQKPGDILYTDEDIDLCPVLVETTGYHMGDTGSHGDPMKEGYVAYTPESYGCAVEIYEAIKTDEGYRLGSLLGLYQIKDTGYGKSTGTGSSRVRSDRRYAGSIESGLSVDRYAPTLQECKKWMQLTNGMVFIQIIPAKG